MADRSRSSPEHELKQLLLGHELELLAKLDERLAGISDRVGDDKVLQDSVRRVIVDVMRDAGIQDHERLSGILAPLVLSSLREEIRNSRDMMVEALYPLTGRLVSAAVRNAFRELLETLDTRLSNAFSFARLRIRLQALFTGRSHALLLLERFPPFDVDDGLVVHRPTGLLVARSRQDDEDEEGIDSDLVGGMLSAIMSFTKDAFGEGDSGELSTLEFGESTLFIHSSPTITLAVQARGTAPGHFAGRLEDAFVAFLDRWRDVFSDFDGEVDPEEQIDMAADLRSRLRAVVSALERETPRPSIWKAAAVVGLVAALLFGWFAMRWVAARQIGQLETTAAAVIRDEPGVAGYPIEATWDRENERLRVEGLVPGYEERDGLRESLAAALPEADLDYRINTLPKAVPPATEKLQKWARANVIFFDRGATPRDDAAVRAKLGEATGLLQGAPADVRLRVVGYADALGSRATNDRLTRARAEYAAGILEELGVSRERLVVVGRPGEQFLTNVVGEGSESRRVEFEVVLTGR